MSQLLPTTRRTLTRIGTCLALNGTAQLVTGTDTVLQITTSAGNQTGSAWYLTPQTVLNGFSTTFQFQFTGPSDPRRTELHSLSRTPAPAHSDSQAETAARSATATPTTMPTPAMELASRTASRLSSTRFKMAGIRALVNGSASHVAIQSCGTGANTSHHDVACFPGGPNSTLGVLSSPRTCRTARYTM